MALKRISRKCMKSLSRELKILSATKGISPFLISLHDCFFSLTQDQVYVLNLLMPRAQTDLESTITQLINNFDFFDELDIQMIMYQLLLGLEALHEQKIAHRDLKPENLLLNKLWQDKDTPTAFADHRSDSTTARPRYQLMLSDFGSAKFSTPGKLNIPEICSPLYRAPELYL